MAVTRFGKTLHGMVVCATVAATLGLSAGTASAAVTSRDYQYGPNDRFMLRALWTATAKKPMPAVIVVHGGGWAKGRYNSPDPIKVATYLSAHGFQAFSVDYRLSAQATWSAQRTDVQDALSWIRARASYFKINTGRIFLIGDSAGGQIATNLGTYGQASKSLRGVVGFSPVADPRLAWDDGNLPTAGTAQITLRDQVNAVAGCATPHTGRCATVLTDMAAKTNASQNDVPMLLYVGTDDYVNHRHSTDLCTALTARGPACTVKVVKGTHGFAGFFSTNQWDVVLWLRSRL